MGGRISSNINNFKIKNIAREGKASQSDNYSSRYGLAHVAIDGNKDGRWSGKSVTHTRSHGKAAWWRLDFSKMYYVSVIRIWNRLDCCSNRLNGVTVRVNDDNKLIATLDTRKGNPIEVKVNGDVKRITIYGSTSFVSLAEVEVFGRISSNINNFKIKNIAREGKTSQSDNYSSRYGLAHVAID